ncbi:DUF4330 family protein [uncultured Oscillibacter sp.]|uniref:DUF4330 family protein n=1 Tax=uncultured Oscillibacter sp. TaxID=876091 RepID=UPI0025FE945B|nr:DUF4330 family protein [uncultured Oscillibacter sp.]
MEEKKAYRIGKFNIVDIIAVAIILAAAVFGATRLLDRGGSVEVPTMDITYVVRVQNVAAELYENAKENLPSPLMASGARLNGRIESVEMTPWLELGPDGQWHEDPDHVNLYFTCTATVPHTEVMTTKVGEQEVRIGKTDYIMKSETVEFQNGTVIDVDWG